MMTFKEYVAEGAYPGWVKVSVTAMVLKIRGLAVQIAREKDPAKQNALIAQQNKLIAYAAGLGVAIGISDGQMMSKLRR